MGEHLEVSTAANSPRVEAWGHRSGIAHWIPREPRTTPFKYLYPITVRAWRAAEVETDMERESGTRIRTATTDSILNGDCDAYPSCTPALGTRVLEWRCMVNVMTRELEVRALGVRVEEDHRDEENVSCSKVMVPKRSRRPHTSTRSHRRSVGARAGYDLSRASPSTVRWRPLTGSTAAAAATWLAARGINGALCGHLIAAILDKEQTEFSKYLIRLRGFVVWQPIGARQALLQASDVPAVVAQLTGKGGKVVEITEDDVSR